ncbi:glycoside hydrolase family 3 N-terminal domain-containing protein [Demequina sp.]|uniref:glycoside hydrolase family 3 protein n=1 Tax=Demequina sp. TaxID=2050685 RepID=UPI0025BFB7BF|nr:glycoside hydrolase family 3 N-terminal domain-containing protein [Demequina sp.]
MNPLAVLMPGFEGTTLPGWVEEHLREGMAGVCLFATNVDSPAQLRELTGAIYAANPHAIVAIDEEGGDVTRLYQAVGSPFPGNAILGRLDDEALTEAVGAHVGQELAAVGVGMTFAPDADVNSTALNPVIGVRSFSADPDVASRHTAAWVRGVEATGVASCAKHFPGHGSTVQDSHHSLPRIDVDTATLDRRELPPFAAAIAAGGRAIMSSHIMVPALDDNMPATFSRAILRGVLRERMGFTGVVVSDALDMAGASAGRGIPAAAAAALHGGCDLLCIGTANTEGQMRDIAATIADAVAAGGLDHEEVSATQRRVADLGRELADARGTSLDRGGFTPGQVPGVTPEAVVRAFAVSERAHALLAEARPRALIRIETEASMAVGPSPWGPFASSGVDTALTVTPESDLSRVAAAVPEGSLAVVIGRDNHRHGLARPVVNAVSVGHDVVTVDMGWPDPDAGLADIATFGASRIAGEALLDLLGW